MYNIKLSSNDQCSLELTGDTAQLLRNRRAKMLLTSGLNADVDGDCIVLKSDKNVEEIVQLVKLACKYIGATLQYDSEVSSEISNIEKAENAFEDFSKAASDIKENNCVAAEFEEFTNSLQKHMLNRTLYPRQLLCAYHMAFSQNACNFSVPGAGKTSIVYGAYTYLHNLPDTNVKKVDKILIIGPLSAFGPWELEYEECYGVKAQCKRINGLLSLDAKKQYFYGDTDELTLVSYASVVSVKDAILHFLRTNKVMVVLDEAHKIKNTSGGITATTIMEIASYCSARIILTGTPAPNGYEDIYNLFNFIWPKRNVTRYNIGQLKDMTRTADDQRVPQLMSYIDPYYIRIKKSDLGIPAPVENPPIIVPMKESQRRIYDFIEQRFMDDLNNASDIHSALVKAKMIRLQQASTNPALLRDPLTDFSVEAETDLTSAESADNAILSDILRFYNEEEIPSKFEACADLIKQILARNEKVVVWAIFIKNIEYLQQYLSSLGIESRCLYGATPVATDGMDETSEQYELTRESIIKQFHQQDSPFKVIIANPFAVAESISLHKVCHNAIYLERSFNCAHFVQSKDRIHRYGLKPGTVTNYYYILSERSIDGTINDRLYRKEQRMIDMVESTPIPLFNNLEEDDEGDIKALIEDYVKRANRTL